jgi:hypothetical protein
VSPWRPPGSVSVTVDGFAMYVLDGEATLVTCEIDMPDSRQLVRGAVDAARRCEASSLQITISPDYLGAGPAIEELRRRGAIRGTDDILAADLAASAPHIRDRPRVEVIEVSTFEQVVEFERTSACGWGYPPPVCRGDPGCLLATHAGLVPGESGRGGRRDSGIRTCWRCCPSVGWRGGPCDAGSRGVPESGHSPYGGRERSRSHFGARPRCADFVTHPATLGLSEVRRASYVPAAVGG